MKRLQYYIYTAILAATSATTLSAQAPAIQKVESKNDNGAGIAVTNANMQRGGDMMNVSMDINFADTKLKGDRVIVYTPKLVNGTDTLDLKSIGLYGHTRWIQHLRNDNTPVSGGDEISYKYSSRPAALAYSESVPFQPWMNGAELVISRKDYGCCSTMLESQQFELAQWNEIFFKPELKYLRPTGVTEKRRELEGSAFIDFPVDQTIIYPEYRRNVVELDSIRRTIDVVRNDPDATIKTVWLKGFASPESPYKHNTDLAIGRTTALKNYIQNLYHFNGVEILTDYEPEDWAGLRVAVVNSNLANRDAILELIDTDMDPDLKEARIKKLYPADYKFMLQEFYPPLRHTNYKVSYVVRSYSDPKEILQIMHTRPGNLSLDEFYTAASILAPGSDEFNEVFETAVRMYPNDAAANLNAANAAIARKDFSAAEKYLAKAGDSAEADYARGVLNVMKENYAAGKDYISKALDKGLKVDSNELEMLRELLDLKN